MAGGLLKTTGPVPAYFLSPRMFADVHYLAHTGVVQTEVIADFLQRIPAAGAGRSDEDVPTSPCSAKSARGFGMGRARACGALRRSLPA